MNREHLHSKLIREIIARVASGTYAVGRRLPAERALCEELAVARGTLRKALSELAGLGVLEIRPNSGIYVRGLPRAALSKKVVPPDFDRVSLSDIVEARKAIELTAARQAAARITAAQVKKLADLVARMAEAIDDIPRFLELDLRFHQAMVRASGNAVLATAFEAIYEYHRFSAIYTSQAEGEEAEALAYHRKLLAALERRDARPICRILGRHLDTMKRYSGRSLPQRTSAGRGRSSLKHRV